MNVSSRSTHDSARDAGVRRFVASWRRVPIGQESPEWCRLEAAFGHLGRRRGASARTLRAIGDLEPCRMTDLASRLGMSPSTTTRAVDRLEAQGLVVRLPDRDDRRSVKVELSPAGSDRLAELDDQTEALLCGVLEAFTTDEIEAMTRSLDQFAAALAEWSSIQDPPVRPQQRP